MNVKKNEMCNALAFALTQVDASVCAVCSAMASALNSNSHVGGGGSGKHAGGGMVGFCHQRLSSSKF